jgi:hydroxymethylglutaryl-CoA lyase
VGAQLLGRIPKSVEIVEVGPRDGLQNEAGVVPAEDKARFVELLADSGLKRIEVTSFVHPKAVPQLADAAEVMAHLQRRPDIRYSALVPNLKGMERALAAGLTEVAVFTGATDTFTRHNVHMTVAETIDAFRPVLARARQHDVRVRGYVSVCFGCPYEGAVAPTAVLDVSQRLLDLGVHELSLGDTIGIATPNQVPEVVAPVIERAGLERLALHFHDTHGTALANVLAALQLGISIFDSSADGLGGCPYAPGAAGNLATERLLYLLDGMGIHTGVDSAEVAEASRFIRGVLPATPEIRSSDE